MTHWGADCTRWFVLSDSPPERDVVWTEAGVAGAGRYIQRLWRTIDEVVQRTSAKDITKPAKFGPISDDLRRTAHKALDQAGRHIEALRFNVAVAQLYELTNALSGALSKTDDGLEWALQETAHLLVQMVGPMMPHLAEECWARLGNHTLLAEQPWPKADPALLVDDNVVIAVQVNGKRRDEITVGRGADKTEVEAKALQLDSVVRALEGRPVKKVIVIPQRIVNVVA
jgi:leucyl-tRNA synthetase